MLSRLIVLLLLLLPLLLSIRQASREYPTVDAAADLSKGLFSRSWLMLSRDRAAAAADNDDDPVKKAYYSDTLLAPP